MKYGIREICDVVLKAKANQMVGNKLFYKGEPVIYFDSLKTSTMEGAATTVYAQGGRGNARLIAWEGERTVTFTMEDALISTAGLLILTGAGLIEATDEKPIVVHCVERVADEKVTYIPASGDFDASLTILVDEVVSENANADIYVMFLDADGNVATEPYRATGLGNKISITTIKEGDKVVYTPVFPTDIKSGMPVLVDYYTDKKANSGAQQIEITPDKFGGNYYLEASTLFRDTNGTDMPAEFIIPNCKVQSNFTFTMASSGDPSTFTFTMDAFPDYTRFNSTKKVLSAIQVIGGGENKNDIYRTKTSHDPAHEDLI